VAKVIAHAPTRENATSILATALRRAHIHGSTTNRALLVRILEHPEFSTAETDTHFLKRHDPYELGRPLLGETEERLAALAAALSDQAADRAEAGVLTTIPSGWRNSAGQKQRRGYVGHYGTHDIEYSLTPFTLNGVGTVAVVSATPSRVAVVIGDEDRDFEVARYGDLRYIDSKDGPGRLVERPRFPSKDIADEPGSLQAPMPGKVIRVGAAQGDMVSEGDSLIVMEAMKMEHTLRAPHRGTVTSVLCAPGDQVEAGAVLVVVTGPDR
jgi:propionyl-CoA carboxylase alpha chain